MLEVKIVETKNELLEFIKFPWKIYKNDPYWVPQLISETKSIFDTKKNPFWKHSEYRLFLVKQDKEILGRVAGIIDRNYIQFQEELTGFFGFFECINDINVCEQLMFSVKNWLKIKGMKKILGPTSPSTNDEMGFLLEGFDSSPYLMMPYNPEYYLELITGVGFRKAKDLYAYNLTQNSIPYERLKKIVEAVTKKTPGLKIHNLNIKNFYKEIEFARNIYNSAWEKNWGFVPWTKEEFDYQSKKLKNLLLPETTLFATINDKPVGMLIAVPNYNCILKNLNGKLGPVELIKFLINKNKINTLRIMIMGVVKEYRNRGIEALLYYNVINNAIKKGFYEGELSWILEDNIMMTRSAEMLGGKLYKKYRVFEMEL